MFSWTLSDQPSNLKSKGSYLSFKNSIALEPANRNYKTRIFGEGRVKIQGILVGLIRKFK